MIKKFPNFTYLCWILSQDVIYRLNFNKKVSKILMNKIEFLTQFDFLSVSASSTIFQLNSIRTISLFLLQHIFH